MSEERPERGKPHCWNCGYLIEAESRVLLTREVCPECGEVVDPDDPSWAPITRQRAGIPGYLVLCALPPFLATVAAPFCIGPAVLVIAIAFACIYPWVHVHHDFGRAFPRMNRQLKLVALGAAGMGSGVGGIALGGVLLWLLTLVA